MAADDEFDEKTGLSVSYLALEMVFVTVFIDTIAATISHGVASRDWEGSNRFQPLRACRAKGRHPRSRGHVKNTAEYRTVPFDLPSPA